MLERMLLSRRDVLIKWRYCRNRATCRKLTPGMTTAQSLFLPAFLQNEAHVSKCGRVARRGEGRLWFDLARLPLASGTSPNQRRRPTAPAGSLQRQQGPTRDLQRRVREQGLSLGPGPRPGRPAGRPADRRPGTPNPADPANPARQTRRPGGPADPERPGKPGRPSRPGRPGRPGGSEARYGRKVASRAARSPHVRHSREMKRPCRHEMRAHRPASDADGGRS